MQRLTRVPYSLLRPKLDVVDSICVISTGFYSLSQNLDLLAEPGPKGGRPITDPRACFEGVLWMVRSGARWKDLPPRFPSRSTVHRRFVEWVGGGVLDRAWKRLMRRLDREGQIDWREGFADGKFATAKNGG